MLSMLCAALALSALAPWADAQRDSDVVVATPVDGDLLSAGRRVEVRAPVDGDVALAGRRVSIAEPVHGYALAVGEAVSVAGAVQDDLWAAGRDVVVAAAVGDNARLAGASLRLQAPARIAHDALLAGRRVKVRAPIGNDLQVRAAEALIASDIGGSVRAHAASLRLAPDAVIHGDPISWGPRPPEIDPGAKVLGRIEHHAAGSGGEWRRLGWLWQWLLGFAALLLLGSVAIAPSKRWSARVADKIRDRFGASLLAGVIALIVVPLLVVVLAASVIGIPLALVVFAFYGALLLLSSVFVSLRIGGFSLARLGRPAASRFARLALGALLLSFVAALPWIGWVAWLLVPIVGLGALLLERRDAWQEAPAAA